MTEQPQPLSRAERDALDRVIGTDARGAYRQAENVWIAARKFFAPSRCSESATELEPGAILRVAQMLTVGHHGWEALPEHEKQDALCRACVFADVLAPAARLPEQPDEDCPDCVEGRTHDVLEGEPVVATCGSCYGTGKREAARLPEQPDEGEDTCECDSCERVFPLSAITFGGGGKSACPDCRGITDAMVEAAAEAQWVAQDQNTSEWGKPPDPFTAEVQRAYREMAMRMLYAGLAARPTVPEEPA